MIDQKLTIDLRGVGNDIPTRLGKSRPTLTTGTGLKTAVGTTRFQSLSGFPMSCNGSAIVGV